MLQVVVWSFGQAPSSSSPLGCPALPLPGQPRPWPCVARTVWGPQVDNQHGPAALAQRIKHGQHNIVNMHSIHMGDMHNQTTLGSYCSGSCNTPESLWILLMLELFHCKCIDLHTVQHAVAADYCKCSCYMNGLCARATPPS